MSEHMDTTPDVPQPPTNLSWSPSLSVDVSLNGGLVEVDPDGSVWAVNGEYGATPLKSAPADARRLVFADLLQAELRDLAAEMHRWAPDTHALRVRDRLLDLARIGGAS